MTDTPAATVLDVTAYSCPMTYVRTRLALDRLQSGQILDVLLRGEDARRQVPASAISQGHTVLACTDLGDGLFRLRLRRA